MTQFAQTRTSINLAQVGVMLLTLATASVHLYMAAMPDEMLRLWFLLNGLGYLGILAALTACYLPQFVQFRRLIRWTLIAYAAATILAWFIFGQPYDALGYATKSIELVLIGLLLTSTYREHFNRS